MSLGLAGQAGPAVLWRQQLELRPSEVLQLPPQPAVEWQDLGLSAWAAEYIFYLQRRLFFWALAYLATTVLT